MQCSGASVLSRMFKVCYTCTRMMTTDAKVLFHNAKIWHSGHQDNTWMVIDQSNGLILDVGRQYKPLDTFPDNKRIDCKGRRILPGLHDSHIHVSWYGLGLNSINLHGASSVEELKARIKKFCELNPGRQCYRGYNWEQDELGRFPEKTDIDEVCPDFPVRLHRVCHHVAVCNSKALQLAGVTRTTSAPPGGEIKKYPAGHPHEGEPTGLLLENAIDLTDEIFDLTEEEILTNWRKGLERCLKYGLTSVHSNEPNTWRQICQIADDSGLPIRVFYAGFFRCRKEDGFPAAGATHGKLLSCDRVKLFADGGLGASTAAISLPYLGTDDQYGIPLYTQEEMNMLVKEANEKGYRLEIHVIGDVAAEMALKALEAAGVPKERRPILTHCQILRKDLLELMKERGVIANIQPQFLTTDATWIRDRVPEQLMHYAYVWKTLMDQGIACAGGSDAPVEEPNPFLGMYDAIFRPAGKRVPNPTPKDMMRPDERLTVTQAIDLYTKGGAYATKAENSLGVLQPGFKADFVIVHSANDICENPEELLTAEAQQVWVEGKLKYQKLEHR